MSSVHPEGEDEKSDPVRTLVCPDCQNQVSVPELANVDVFVCPKCGGQIRIPQGLELRP